MEHLGFDFYLLFILFFNLVYKHELEHELEQKLHTTDKRCKTQESKLRDLKRDTYPPITIMKKLPITLKYAVLEKNANFNAS